MIATLIIVALIQAFTAWMISRTHKETVKLKLHINSKMDELLKLTQKSSFAEGKLAGQEENRNPS